MKFSALLSFCLVLNISPSYASPHPDCIAPSLKQKCIEAKCRSFPFDNCEAIVNAYPAGDQCCDEETLEKFSRGWYGYYPYHDPYTTTRNPNDGVTYSTGVYYSTYSYTGNNTYTSYSTSAYNNRRNYSTNSSRTGGRRGSTSVSIRPRFKRHTPYVNVTKWESPVSIYIDINGASKNTYKRHIMKALEKITSVTCLKFNIVEEKPTTPHITFLKHTEGCASFVGKRKKGSNPIVGNDACLSKPGNILALLAQTLGLWHQTQRYDRDHYVSFLLNNIKDQEKANFGKLKWMYSHNFNLLYDFASITHYSAKMFSKNGKYSVAPFTNDFLSTIGQRVELSFLDAELLNHMYCSDQCKESSTHCGNGGYPDPRNCSHCICQPGFKGEFCAQGVSTSMGCGGELRATTDVASFNSPNFENGRYPDNVECEWLIKAFSGKVELSFDSDFDIYADEQGVCQNWVEVRYRNNVSLPGPRFCGNETITEKIVSFTSDVVVIFKSKSFENSPRSHKGFKLEYKAIDVDPCLDNPCLNGAQCLRVNETYRCRCADGFVGDKCQTALSSVADPCSLQPCLNGGECMASGGSFMCRCEDGFHGKYCEKGNCGGCGANYYGGYTTKCRVLEDPPRQCNRTFSHVYCYSAGNCETKEYTITFPCVEREFCCDYAVEQNGQCYSLGWTGWTECSGGCGYRQKSRSFYQLVDGRSIKLKTESQNCPYQYNCYRGGCSMFLSYLGYC